MSVSTAFRAFVSRVFARRPRAVLALALLAQALPVSPRALHAQALATEDKAADIQIGGAFSYGFPDYTPHRFYGPGLYLDIDLRRNIGIEGSINFLNRPAPNGITEKTYQVGARYRFNSPRLHGMRSDRLAPYVRFNFGRGVFNFGYTTVINPAPPPATLTAYNADFAYNICSLGGGLDFHLNRAINLRIIDYQHQIWTGFQPHGLNPDIFSAGVAYHFH